MNQNNIRRLALKAWGNKAVLQFAKPREPEVSPQNWPPAKLEIMTKHYATMEPDELMNLLDKPWNTIQQKARRMGIFRARNNPKTRKIQVGELIQMACESIKTGDTEQALNDLSRAYKILDTINKIGAQPRKFKCEPMICD